MSDHQPPEELPPDPVDWDLEERDAWLAEHGDDDTPAPVEVVVAEDE